MRDFWFSVVLITKNEADKLPACLASLDGLSDDFIVVDSDSTDGTIKIAEQFGCRVIQRVFDGYGQQKNFGNEQAKYNHILSIDADEVLSDELQESIKKATPHSAFRMSRRTSYCGNWVDYSGWYPDLKIRLFDKRIIRWNHSKVHERLLLPSGTTVQRLHGDLLHYSIDSIGDHIDRIKKYARFKAEMDYEKGRFYSRVKRRFLPAFKFLEIYFFKRGFLDKKTGWHIAKNSAKGVNWRQEYLREIWRERHA